jgi:hypothetical protein
MTRELLQPGSRPRETRRTQDKSAKLAITLVMLKITRDSWRTVTTTEPGELVELVELVEH